MGAFAAATDRVAAKVKRTVTDQVVAYATTLHQQLVLLTPQLSGQAAANWQVSLSSVGGANIYGTPPRPGSVPVASIAASQEATIRQYVPGQTLYIYNALSYIGDLNNGSSAKAPAGFIETAVMTAQATLKR